MKKNFYYAMISAALLTGAAGFSACSSDDVTEDTGLPGNAQEVKTEFAINIPRAGKAGRMTAENTQNDGKFLGMKGIHLIPMESAATGTGTAFYHPMTLKDIQSNEIPEDKATTKIYKDVSVPLGTTHFLFYGHAAEGADASTQFEKGILSAYIISDKNKVQITNSKDVRFELNLIDKEGAYITQTNNEGQGTKGQGTKLLEVLNALAGISVKDQPNPDYTWAALKDKAENLSAGEAELGKLYKKFIELRAGSANSILQTLGWLSVSVNRINAGENTNAANLKQAIADEIDKVVSVNPQNSDSPTFSWKGDLTFPKNINLPDGVAKLEFKDKTFSYAQLGNIGGDGTTNPNVNVASLTFPASLYYKANTEVRTGSATDEFPKTTDEWKKENWEKWGTSVVPTTAKIALKDAVNYAVGVLELKVKCKTKQLPTADKEDDDNPTTLVTVPVDGFPVTGLLIGGQPVEVDYDFKPVYGEGKNAKSKENCFVRTIYDNAITEEVRAKYAAEQSTWSASNYTLVLPNNVTGEVSEVNPAQTVNFAVELTNNSGADFRGADGIVPNGGTFYLIGKLDPNKTGVTGNDNNDVKAKNVFESDYKTTARVTISTLAKAYNCIPDLRATNLELGLAVDLIWEKGLTFDVEIGQ